MPGPDIPEAHIQLMAEHGLGVTLVHCKWAEYGAVYEEIKIEHTVVSKA